MSGQPAAANEPEPCEPPVPEPCAGAGASGCSTPPAGPPPISLPGPAPPSRPPSPPPSGRPCSPLPPRWEASAPLLACSPPALRTLALSGLPWYLPDAHVHAMLRSFGVVRALHDEGRHAGVLLASYYDLRHAEAAAAALAAGAWPEGGTWLTAMLVPPPEAAPLLEHGGVLAVSHCGTTPLAQLSAALERFGDLHALSPQPGLLFVEFCDSRDAVAARAALAVGVPQLPGCAGEYAAAMPVQLPCEPPFSPVPPSPTWRGVPLLPRAVSWHALPGAASPGPPFSPNWPGAPPSPFALWTRPPARRHRSHGGSSDGSDGLHLTPPGLPGGASSTASGSGSSGEGVHPPREAAAEERAATRFAFDPAEAAQAGGRTTVMLRHVPNKCTRAQLRSALEAAGFQAGRDWDVLYLPLDWRLRSNLGYAFVNATAPAVTAALHAAFDSRAWAQWPNSAKLCSVRYAKVQGWHALLAHFRASKLSGSEGPGAVQPLLVLSDGRVVEGLGALPGCAPVEGAAAS